MSAATSQTFSKFLKTIWPTKTIAIETISESKTYGMIPKFTDWKGDTYPLPFGWGDTGGFSSDFSAAQANKKPTKEGRFSLTPTSSYSLFSVQRQVARRSQNGGAVLEAVGRQSSGALNTWKKLNSVYLFGNGGGSLATVTAVGTTDITVSTEQEVLRFDTDYTVVASSDDGTGGAGTRAGKAVIASVDVANRKLYCASTTTWGTLIPNIQVGDSIFIDGTYGDVVSGFKAWLMNPADVTSTAFFGQDRTQNKQRMAGTYVDISGLSPTQAAKRLALEVWRQSGGKSPDWYILGPERFNDLSNDLEASGRLIRTTAPAAKIDDVSFGISYDAISFMGPTGEPITVTCDWNCGDSDAFMLRKSSWRLVGIGAFPYLDNMGGDEIMREANADAYEGRWVSDIQLGCDAPGWNGRGAF